MIADPNNAGATDVTAPALPGQGGLEDIRCGDCGGLVKQERSRWRNPPPRFIPGPCAACKRVEVGAPGGLPPLVT
jgi:hypothetical protein